MPDTAIRIENLSKQYRIGAAQPRYHTLRDSITEGFTKPFRLIRNSFRQKSRNAGDEEDLVWALEGVTAEIKAGEVVGVIGRNGAGKSTLLKILSRITEPTTGFADVYGRVGSLLEVGTGFHNELTGRENVYLNGAILGMKKVDIARQFDAMVAFAEVEKFIDTPVKFYSSGMYLRLAFAVAAHLNPDILLVDEVLAVGDLAFQKKCLGRMSEVAQTGRTVLFVSHNLGAVRSLCDRGIVLNKGKLVYSGSIGKSIECYYKITTAADATDEESAVSAGRSGFGRVALSSHDGPSIQQNEPFEVATTLHISGEIAGFSLICSFTDMQQRQVFHVREESSAFRNGSGCWSGSVPIRLRVPPLYLEPGLYSLVLKAFFWGDRNSARHVADTLNLDVGGESSGWGAVLTPKVSWHVSPENEPVVNTTMGALA
jgi:lipopolysaccharide transport system ATP-binding protein